MNNNAQLSPYINDIFNITIEKKQNAAKQAAGRLIQEHFGANTKWKDLSDAEKDFFVYYIFYPHVMTKDWINFNTQSDIDKIKNKVLKFQLKTPIPQLRSSISKRAEELFRHDYFIPNASSSVNHAAYEQFVSDLKRYFLIWIDASDFHIPTEAEWLDASAKKIEEVKNKSNEDPSYRALVNEYMHGMRICDYLLDYEQEGDALAHDSSFYEQQFWIEKVNTFESILNELGYIIENDSIIEYLHSNYESVSVPFPDLDAHYNAKSGITREEYNSCVKANTDFLTHQNLLKHKAEHHTFYHRKK